MSGFIFGSKPLLVCFALSTGVESHSHRCFAVATIVANPLHKCLEFATGVASCLHGCFYLSTFKALIWTFSPKSYNFRVKSHEGNQGSNAGLYSSTNV